MVTARQWVRMGVAVLAVATTAVAADAQITPYVGFDLGANAPGANAIAARNAFVGATGGSVQIDFEAPGLPAGVGLTGGTRTNTGQVNCPPSLCGGNTTSGGSFWYELLGGSATFTFASPVSYFGAYFGGLQLPGANTLTFTDGAGNQLLAIPGDFQDGGFGFVGFSSASGGISTILVTASDPNNLGDIISIDDVIFGAQAVPEPATFMLLATGLVGLAGMARRQRRTN